MTANIHNAGGWIAIAAVLATTPALAAPLGPPPPDIAALVLPTGRLSPLAANEQGVAFLEQGTAVRLGSRVTVIELWVVNDPTMHFYGKLVNQEVQRMQYDCDQNTVTALGIQAFDADGELVIWAPDGQVQSVTPGSIIDGTVKAVCRGYLINPANDVVGHDAAVIAAQSYMHQATAAKSQ